MKINPVYLATALARERPTFHKSRRESGHCLRSIMRFLRFGMSMYPIAASSPPVMIFLIIPRPNKPTPPSTSLNLVLDGRFL